VHKNQTRVKMQICIIRLTIVMKKRKKLKFAQFILVYFNQAASFDPLKGLSSGREIIEEFIKVIGFTPTGRDPGR
jgi:hypothetical protein